MDTILKGNEIYLHEAANLVATCGTTNTFIFEGEPGIGKSSMRDPIMSKLRWAPERFIYIDAALLDVGDLQMPANRGEHIEFLPNKMFKHDEPVVVFVDEIGKASRPVKNALLTLLLERRVGSTYLPEGSMVFGATNMATDGVGDVFEAHGKNRVSFMRIRKPKAGFKADGSVDPHSWAEWAMEHDVNPMVLAWVRQFPHCLDQSYVDFTPDEKIDNPYVFNPRDMKQAAFVSGRSLYHASRILDQRDRLSEAAVRAALVGTIGEQAALDMQAFISLADELPPLETVLAKPDTTPVPTNPAACVIQALNAVRRVDREHVSAWITYMRRMPAEIQFMFVQQAMRAKDRVSFYTKNTTFTDWARENSWAI